MFHWICPECGREIPPSVRECQACDPNAAASPVVESVKSEPAARPLLLENSPVAPPALEAPAVPPVAVVPPPAELEPQPAPEAEAVVEAAPVEPPIAEPILETPAEPRAAEVPVIADRQPELEPQPAPEVVAVVEAAPVDPSAAEPVLETSAEPLVVELPVAASQPELEPQPAPQVNAEAAPVEPVVEIQAEPTLAEGPVIADSAPAPPVIELEPVAQPAPQAVAEAAPVEPFVVEPVVETATEPPVAEVPVIADSAPTPPAAELEPSQAEAVAEAAAVESIVAASPAPEPALEIALPVEAAPPSAAVTQAAPVEPRVEAAAEDLIKLHDVPDPLLALAEEIRAAQAARAVALSAPAPASGLRELAEAVGVQEPELKPEQAAQTELVSEPADPFSKTQKLPIPDVDEGVAEAITALALLAPPEPLAVHELRPAALAPEPSPEPQPVALAPEPQSEPGPEVLMLPFAPMQEYRPATSRSILPVPPKAQILAADPGPRITLPGPTLPPELTRLQDANVLTVIGEATAERTKEAIPPSKSAGAPGWMVSALVMLLLLCAGLGIVFYLLPHTVADAKPAPTPAVAATTPAPTGGTSPLAKFIEVTGFRIVTSVDPNKKSEVQYLVVNHSDADISDANVFVTLRGIKPGQAPICRFSFKVPSLGPFESKEMSSPIEKAARSLSLPEWQELRAEVQISQ